MISGEADRINPRFVVNNCVRNRVLIYFLLKMKNLIKWKIIYNILTSLNLVRVIYIRILLVGYYNFV